MVAIRRWLTPETHWPSSWYLWLARLPLSSPCALAAASRCSVTAPGADAPCVTSSLREGVHPRAHHPSEDASAISLLQFHFPPRFYATPPSMPVTHWCSATPYPSTPGWKLVTVIPSCTHSLNIFTFITDPSNTLATCRAI